MDILIAALLMAVAGIAGMLFLYHWGMRNGIAASLAQIDLFNARENSAYNERLAVDAVNQAKVADARAAAAERQVKELSEQLPHYGRDPKTGRFAKKPAWAG